MEAAESQFVICDVCKKSMEDARILPCFHSFCLKCLESSGISGESSQCPTCGFEFQMPRGGAKSLKKNSFIKQLISLDPAGLCDSCREKRAVKFCIECDFNYCSLCLTHHNRIPTSRNHYFLPSRSPKSEYTICRDHLEEKTLFCEVCNVVVCAKCSSSKHSSHKTIQISDYFEVVKVNLEQDIEKTQKLIKTFEIDLKNYEEMLSDSNMKAFALKNEIQEKGKELKREIDSYVSRLIENVDLELDRHQKEAEDIVNAIKNKEAALTGQVENLKQQLKNLNYKNVLERSLIMIDRNKNIPNYSENFDILFSWAEGQRLNLTKALGTLKKSTKFKFIKKVRLNCSYTSFAANQNEIFAYNTKESRIDVMSYDGSICKSSFDLKNKLSCVIDLLLIDSKLYVLGKCSENNDFIITEVDITSLCKQVVIYSFHHKIGILRLSKSLCGNLILFLENKIIHISRSGDVTKTVTLDSDVFDAVQLDEHLYACCSEEGVVIMDDSGRKVSQCPPSKEMVSPFRLVKDNFGNIYISDLAPLISVLNDNLEVMSSHAHGNYVYEILYCEETNMLLILNSNHELSTFQL